MNIKKVIGICLVVVLVITALSTSVLGFTYEGFDGKVETASKSNDTDQIAGVGNTILSVIRILGMILSIGTLMILGIKYMLGSTEEKADYKKTMIPYLVGAILIFAATFIVSAIYNFAD